MPTDLPPSIVWFRRDLRLADHPALSAAVASGGPVIPVFILDPETEALGAAAKWRLGLSIADLQGRLRARGSDLILRRGDAVEALRALADETGARSAHWTRLYGPDTVSRDKAVKAALTEVGVEATSHPGHLLHEPWIPETKHVRALHHQHRGAIRVVRMDQHVCQRARDEPVRRIVGDIDRAHDAFGVRIMV